LEQAVIPYDHRRVLAKGERQEIVEEDVISRQVDDLINRGIHLQGDIVSVDELASYYNVSPESVNRILHSHYPVGYLRLGEYYVSIQRAEELTDEIGRLGSASLTTALDAIEKHGFKHPERVLEDLGYSLIWNCPDYQNDRMGSTVRVGRSPITED